MPHQDIDALGQMVMARRVKQRLFGVQPPDKSARYVPIERIGSGGGGTVYRAYDSKLRREVAIKVLHVAQDRVLQSGLATSVILREARSLAALSHPHVVAVHDVGRVVGGELVSGSSEDPDDASPVFLVMEYIEGQDLGSYIRSKKPNYEQLFALFEQAASGLIAAHSVGLVHRDFKPANVLVGKDGRVRVIDFGLATGNRVDEEGLQTHSEPDEDTTQPRLDSGMVGTPAYMSPEARAREPMGPKTDQFSFCVALYEAIYGLRPMACQEGEFPGKLPSSLHALPVGTPPQLDRILVRGLAQNPDQRYPNLKSLLEALRSSPGRKLWRWWPALAAPLLTFLAWSLWEGQIESQCKKEAQIQALQGQLGKLEGMLVDENPRINRGLSRIGSTLVERVRGDVDEATQRCVRQQGGGIEFGPWASFRHQSLEALLRANELHADQLIPRRVEIWGQEIAQLRDQSSINPSLAPSQWSRCVQSLLDLDLRWIRGKNQQNLGQNPLLVSCIKDSTLPLQAQVARHLARIDTEASFRAAKTAYFSAVEQRRADLAVEMATRVGAALLSSRGWESAEPWLEHAMAWQGQNERPSCPALRGLQDRIDLARDPSPEHYRQIIEDLANDPAMIWHRLRLSYELGQLLVRQGETDKAQRLRGVLHEQLEDHGLDSVHLRDQNIASLILAKAFDQAEVALQMDRDPSKRGLMTVALRLWLGLQVAKSPPSLKEDLGQMQQRALEVVRQRGCQRFAVQTWESLLVLEAKAMERLDLAGVRVSPWLARACKHAAKKSLSERLDASFAAALLAGSQRIFYESLKGLDPSMGRCP